MPHRDPNVRKMRDRERARRWYSNGENRRRKLTRMAEWRSSHPEESKERKRACYRKHATQYRAAAAAYHSSHRGDKADYDRVYHPAYLKAHPEVSRAGTAARRARKVSNGPVERILPSEIWKRDGGICGLCGLAADARNWHLDHILPLALGGPHTNDNVQVAHPSCNLRKGARRALEGG